MHDQLLKCSGFSLYTAFLFTLTVPLIIAKYFYYPTDPGSQTKQTPQSSYTLPVLAEQAYSVPARHATVPCNVFLTDI